MKMKLATFMLICSSFSYGQNNLFEWDEGLTYYTGEFDTTNYSKEEIETIYNYLHSPSSEMLMVGNIWKIEQMDTATTIPVDNYYNQTLKILETMRIPEGEFWDSLLVYRKRELFENCQANRIFILAIKTPSILVKYYHEACQQEINALNGDTTQLLEAWRELKDSQKQTNGDPARLEQEYQTQLNSKNRLKYARLDLMKYGWGNCNNQFVYQHVDYSIEDAFQQLFIRVEREDEED